MKSDHIILICATLFLCAALWITQLQPQIDARTAPGHRAGAVWRGYIPYFDIGLDAFPAGRSRSGYLEAWLYPHWAEENWYLFQLPGHRKDIFGTGGMNGRL